MNYSIADITITTEYAAGIKAEVWVKEMLLGHIELKTCDNALDWGTVMVELGSTNSRGVMGPSNTSPFKTHALFWAWRIGGQGRPTSTIFVSVADLKEYIIQWMICPGNEITRKRVDASVTGEKSYIRIPCTDLIDLHGAAERLKARGAV